MKLNVWDLRTEDWHPMLRPRPADGHKGTFGHALLVAGSKGMAGAAILSAEACLRSGLGKLSVLTAEENRPILQSTVPEAILASSFSDTGYEAVGIGPGLGRNFEVLDECLRMATGPLVVDADALNMLGERREWQTRLPAQSILTPHPKEAERLTGGCSVEEISAYATAHGVYVVLKGHPTHVCAPGGEVFRLTTGNSGMATAGSGDVLTGIVTGLLAQGYSPLEAALTGVWIHGCAGDLAADEMGENCMLARDIIRHMPGAFGRLKIEN